jgi:hypothetical protein
MRLLHIDLGNLGIVTDHVQAAMPQHLLQGEDIATRSQKSNCEGVPEFVRVGVFHPGPFSDAFDQEAQRTRVEMSAMLVEKNRRIGIICVFPVNQVAPHRLAGRLPQVRQSLTVRPSKKP